LTITDPALWLFASDVGLTSAPALTQLSKLQEYCGRSFNIGVYHTRLCFPSVGGNRMIGNRLLRIRILALPFATLM
jgi:hypothetical protein